MQLVRRLFDFYIDASFHVAFSACSLVFCTGILLHFKVNVYYSAFVFLATLTCYNFMKYGVEAKKYAKKHKSFIGYIWVISIMALFLSIYVSTFFSKAGLLWLAGCGLLTFLYGLPVLPKSGKLRNVGLLKIATVAVVWAVITVNVAMVISEISLTHDAWIEAIQRFLLVLVLMVPFEIRDMHKDAAELHTLPQLVGVLNAKRIALALSILLYALTFFKTEITAMDVWGKLLLTLLLLLAIVFTKTKRSKRFASFWVEGIPIIWLGVLVLLENYF